MVAAPSKIPRGSGERVKTDRRDAELLARLLVAGKLHPVRVPGREEEALRDLIRAREAVRVDLMRCRHRLSKLLLRHGIRFEDGDAWTTRHQQWLSTLTLEQPAAHATLLDARGAVDALVHRREQLEREIVALLPGSPWSVQSSRLRCMRGLDTLSAVGLCAEVGEPDRHPPRRPPPTPPNQRKQEIHDATLDARPSISSVKQQSPSIAPERLHLLPFQHEHLASRSWRS